LADLRRREKTAPGFFLSKAMREPKSNNDVRKGVKSIPPLLPSFLDLLDGDGLFLAILAGDADLGLDGVFFFAPLPLLPPPSVGRSIYDFLFYNNKYKIIFIYKHKKQ
jgi:hypothetical protein